MITEIIKIILIIFIGFTGGLMISGAIFAFITIIGVVPSIAYKTKTTKFMRYYEECVIFGGIFGAFYECIEYKIPIGNYFIGIVFIVFFSLCIGIFFGVLASSLAETLDVIPIFVRRAKVEKNIAPFMIAIGIGKMVGSLIYFFVTGFQR